MKRRPLWTIWSAVVVTTAAVGISATTASATVDWQQRVDAVVLSAAGAGPTDFLVYMNEQADLSGSRSLRTKLTVAPAPSSSR